MNVREVTQILLYSYCRNWKTKECLGILCVLKLLLFLNDEQSNLKKKTQQIALIPSLFENTYNFSQILQVHFCVAERWWRGGRDCMRNQFYKLTIHSGLICKENVFLSVNWIGLCTFLVGNWKEMFLSFLILQELSVL